MGALIIRIETDNAAFEEDAAPELARILHALADWLPREGIDPCGTDVSDVLRDINGNRVGGWRWSDDGALHTPR